MSVEASSLPPELLTALTSSLQNKNVEEAQHHAGHMISMLADAAAKLADVNDKSALGTSTLKGVLAAIDQQIGALEAPSHTKQ